MPHNDSITLMWAARRRSARRITGAAGPVGGDLRLRRDRDGGDREGRILAAADERLPGPLETGRDLHPAVRQPDHQGVLGAIGGDGYRARRDSWGLGGRLPV